MATILDKADYPKIRLIVSVVVIVFLAGLNAQMAIGHFSDDAQHLNDTERYIIDSIIHRGFTFSEEEKIDVYHRLDVLETKFKDAIERWDRYLDAKGY
ncbi:MAG: hypothetical protein GY804_09745 [Alphaproteobacteria bacterium]|nr:hypothetical protein [Alphaproteobacteria bacterium]